MTENNRRQDRVEPAFLDAILKYNDQHIRGTVLNSSRGGMAVDFSGVDILPAVGEEADILITITGSL